MTKLLNEKPSAKALSEVMQPSELPIERLELGLGSTPDKIKSKMVIKTISATYGRKFNLGEYESATIEASAWADLDTEENPDENMDALHEFCKKHVRTSALPVLRARSKGGEEFVALETKYDAIELILEEALSELTVQEPHEEKYAELVKRLNDATGRQS